MSTNEPKQQESEVTPWTVQGKIDYTRLVKEFGTECITDELKIRFEKVTGKPLHPWIKRGIFFSHRGLEKILDAYENGEFMFLYTGRGPSNDMHLGHMIPFIFTKWLQDVFNCPLVIQISDEEKYYFKNLDFQTTYDLGRDNAKDIIAFGFNPEKTFIFSNRDYRMEVRDFEKFVCEMKKNISAKQVSKVFGFGECIKDENGVDNYVYKDDVTIGMMDWPFYQTAAAFSRAFPHIFNGHPAHCLVPYAIDQDNYFRMGRDLAGKMKLIKPCSIISTFLDPIRGSGKMSSSSGQEATIFLTDNAETIRSKITKFAFSGSRGSGSLEDHRKLGGDVESDIPCRYLKYFEYDDAKYQAICDGFASGEISCSETKKILIEKLIEVIAKHQNCKSLVTDEIVSKFYEHRSMDLSGRQLVSRELNEQEKSIYEMLDSLQIKCETLYHKPILTAEDESDVAARLRGEMTRCALMQDANKQIYLFVTSLNAKVDPRAIGKSLNLEKLRFVEKAFCNENFGISSDRLSIFILSGKNINVIIDKNLSKNEFISFNPLGKDASSSILYSNMIKFIESQKCSILYYKN